MATYEEVLQGVQSLKDNADETKTKVSAVVSSVSELKGTISQLQEQITQLQSQVGGVLSQEQLDNLASLVSQASTSVQSVEDAADQVQTA